MDPLRYANAVIMQWLGDSGVRGLATSTKQDKNIC
jgi:hypothetical protein